MPAKRIDDGFSTLITLGAGNAHFWEKTVTPPGVEAGGGINVTTMHNTAWRTQKPKKLKSLTDSSFTAAYDAEVLTAILAEIGVNQAITITFPDGEEVLFYGWLDSFILGEHTEGEQPEAQATVIASNVHSTTGAETPPAYTFPA